MTIIVVTASGTAVVTAHPAAVAALALAQAAFQASVVSHQ